MSSVLQAVGQPTNPPALARALPYIQSGSLALLSLSLTLTRAAFGVLTFIAKIIAHPIVFLSPLPALLYILAPLIVFVNLFLDVAVYTPYRVITYLSDAFYPLYVFLGVACIAGALVGLGGRFLVLGLVYISGTQPPRQPTVDMYDEKERRIS
ncbi:hypothetical protein B0H10DRAFT_2073028 [Mycena sp. CBHHK59/15]|nr:hypothetical protein B0H10DRAFT_2073028 [Mycena sp. CBHHK59/15]